MNGVTTLARVFVCSQGGDGAVFHEIAALVQAGGVVAIPTESSYGLGASPFYTNALERLCRLKGRSDDKPILVLIAEPAQVDLLVREIPPAARLLMEAFWPGPLTIVLPAKASLPAALTAGTGSVGVRCTAYAPLANLLRVTGPLTGTSANRSGDPPAQTAETVQTILGSEIAAILDAGTALSGLPSTVVDARAPVTLIREGPVTRAALMAVLQRSGVQLM